MVAVGGLGSAHGVKALGGAGWGATEGKKWSNILACAAILPHALALPVLGGRSGWACCQEMRDVDG